MNRILYECSHYVQWIRSYETVQDEQKPTILLNFPSSIKESLNFFRKRDFEISQFMSKQLPWQLAVSDSEGKYIALLQEELLEIRLKNDDYTRLLVQAAIPADELFQYRKLEWSPNTNLIITSTSDGLISGYDVTGDNLFTIRVTNSDELNSFLPGRALASLIFMNSRLCNAEWLYEIIAINYTGELHCYHVSKSNNFKEDHVFTFGNLLSVSEAVYDRIHNIIIVAFPLVDCSLKEANVKSGLSSWRLLNDYPYYKLVFPSSRELYSYKCDKHFPSRLLRKFYGKERSIIVKMKISSEGEYLACLHTCGSISLWQLPSLRLHKVWPLREQLDSNKIDHYPVDINWTPVKKLIVARNDGSLSIYDIETLSNQLETLEFVNNRISIANICDINKGYLILESRSKYFSSTSTTNVTSQESDEKQPRSSHQIIARTGPKYLFHFIWKFIFSESIQSPKKNSKFVQKIYQLHCMKSITPEEMYSRKIDNKEYKDALEFAELHNLDKNRVYQKQWLNSPVSEESINNYLSNITDSWWVLNESCERIAESLPAAEFLLLYGLQLTEFTVFLSYNNEQLADELLSSNQVHSDVRTVEFTDKQLDLLQIRVRLLHYYDRLLIYKEILRNRNGISSYNKKVYDKFRNSNAVNAAIFCAQEGDCDGVGLIFAYYSDYILSHYLQILDNIPETVSPLLYRDLLPKYDKNNNKIILPEKKQLREADWSEGSNLKHYVKPLFHYDNNSNTEKDLTTSRVFQWYYNRIKSIEESSGLIDYSLQLLEIASSYNIPNLEKLHSDLFVLSQLVFDLEVEDVSLSSIEKMSNSEKLKLLMKQTNATNFLNDFNKIAVAFLIKCNRLYPGSLFNLLKDYLLELVNTNNLRLVFLFFQKVIKNNDYQLFANVEEMVSLGITCLYENKNIDQISFAFKMINELRRQYDNSLDGINALEDNLDELECELFAIECLQNYNVSSTVAFIHENKRNEELVKSLLVSAIEFKLNRQSKIVNKDLEQLLDDILWLQANIFFVLPKKTCLEIFAFMLLTSNEINVIRYCSQVLMRLQDDENEQNAKSRHEKNVTLVLDAARQHFNSAVTYYDSNITLAKTCLGLVDEQHSAVKEELDLIRALEILHSFGVFLLPLQVRNEPDRFHIITKCLRESLLAYKKTEQLLQLAEYLRIFKKDETDGKTSVLVKAAETALEVSDFTSCATVCLQMTDLGPSAKTGWKICTELCKCNEYVNNSTKRKLILFALLYCPESELLDVMKIRNKLELNIIQKSVQETISELQRRESIKKTSPVPDNSCQLKSDQIKLETSDDNFQFVSNLIKNVPLAGSELFSLNFWKNSFGLNNVDDADESAIHCNNNDCTRQAFPEFYAQLHVTCKCYLSPRNLVIDRDEHFRLLIDLLKSYIFSVQLNETNCPDRVKYDPYEVICHCCSHLITNDCYQLFGFLMLLRDAKYSEECFKNFPNTLICKKIALFYYIVKFGISSSHISPKNISRSYPASLISTVMPVVNRSVSDLPTVELITKYKEQIENFFDVVQLQQLNCGIDLNRFYSDNSYKVDSILGLAMCVEKDKLDLALKLAKQNDVPVEEVLINYFMFLFFNNEHSTMNEVLSDNDILKLLKENSTTLSQKLKKDVYSNLHGCNYQSLILFYTILNNVDNEAVFNHLTPKEHIKLLKKVKATASAINYKMLTAEPPAILDAVLPATLPDNVSHIVKFVKSLPREFRNIISPSEIYDALVKKIFPVYENGTLPLMQQLKLFESCCEYLQYMKKADIMEFIYAAAFSNYSYINRDVQMRKEFLDLLIESSQSCNSETMKDLHQKFLIWEQYFNKMDKLHNTMPLFKGDSQMWRLVVFYIIELDKNNVDDFFEKIFNSTEFEFSPDIMQKVSDEYPVSNDYLSDSEIDSCDKDV